MGERDRDAEDNEQPGATAQPSPGPGRLLEGREPSCPPTRTEDRGSPTKKVPALNPTDRRLPAEIMESGAQYPFLANAPLPRYEQLKEEQELSALEANVPVATTMVHMSPQVYVTAVRDHVVWSIFNAMFCNCCCLGVMAMAFSVKSRDRKLVGDVEGATSYGNTAKSLNIAALLLTLLIITLVIVLFATGVIALKQFINQMDEERLNTFDDFVQRHGK